MRPALLLLLALVASCANIIDLEERKVAADAGADGSVSATCDAYCAQAQERCPGLFYKNEVGCMGVCQEYAVGDSAQPKGNTLACRMKALENAKVYNFEAQTYCPGAGPGGAALADADSCGTLCENYCKLYETVCKDFAEIPDCQNKCLLLPSRMGGTTADMDFASAADTVQCRLAHVTAAATAKSLGDRDAQKSHCGHSGLKSNQLCDVSDERVADIQIQCSDFCRLTMGACQGPDQVYESPAQCEAVCGRLVSGSIKDITSKTDSRRCRRENAYAALVEPDANLRALACSNASPIPSQCGAGRCATYCALAKTACTALYPGDQQCEASCNQLSDRAQNINYSIPSALGRGSPLNCRAQRVAKVLASIAIDQGIPPGACEAALGLPSAGGGPTECQ